MTFVFLVFAFIAGLIGGYSFRRQNNSHDSLIFTDPDIAEEMGAKGNAVVADRIAKRKQRILKRAVKRQRITNDDVEDLFCIGDVTARKYLNELVESGKLVRKGSGGSTHYLPL